MCLNLLCSRFVSEFQKAKGEETKAKEKLDDFRKKVEAAQQKLKNYESTVLESQERTKAAKENLDVCYVFIFHFLRGFL